MFLALLQFFLLTLYTLVMKVVTEAANNKFNSQSDDSGGGDNGNVSTGSESDFGIIISVGR